MTIQASILDILFRRVSPNQVYDLLVKSEEIGEPEDVSCLFRKYAVHTLKGYSKEKGYSKDEIVLIAKSIQEEAEKKRKSLYNSGWYNESGLKIPPMTQASMAIYSVLILADRLLCHQGSEPFCKIEGIGEWRKAYLNLGQDLFVCAYLADEDIKNGCIRHDFTWSPVLPTNHSGLNALLKRGLAENHQHLYGSSRTFELSWCSLMNYPDTHRIIGKMFEELYQPYTAIGPEKRFVTTGERVTSACFFRMILFKWLFFNQEMRHCSSPEQVKVNWDQKDMLFFPLEQVVAFREAIGAKIPQEYGRKACLDYAFTEQLYHETPDACYRSLAGERYFLYLYFKAFLLGKTNRQYDYLFYLYIILKTMFRNELIQVNEIVGFRNFSDYQDRKTELCEQPFYQAELIRMAINAPMGKEHIDSLETRITPKKSISHYQKVIYQIDHTKYVNDQHKYQIDYFLDHQADLARMAFNSSRHNDLLEVRIKPQEYMNYSQPLAGFNNNKKYIMDYFTLKKSAKYLPYFYLIHFVKKPDQEYLDYIKRIENRVYLWPSSPKNMVSQCSSRQNVEFYSLCRHKRLRDTVCHQAIILSNALHRDEELRHRIRGIDCASQEIGCSPEVFAKAYRILRGYRDSDILMRPIFHSQPFSLSATYHAGEDFLDILSALRAIDEAISFLELRRNDRIGHALGLGVDAETHYDLKGRRVFIPKQQRLDDLVWLLNRCRDLGLHIDPHVYGKLKEEAELLFFEIYGGAMERWGWNIHLTEYYSSMWLRADDPEIYKNWKTPGYYKCRKRHPVFPDFLGEINTIPSLYESFRISHYSDALPSYRKSWYLTGLYYLYHYGLEERKKGNEVCEVLIDKDYIRLMTEAQNVLQREIASKGIIIECNPSSNVLIGTFKSYQKHPIFRFNHTGLQGGGLPEQAGEPLQVCINTDDLGVFDTSLEFEYTLLFDALKQMDNEDGSPAFTEAQILDYLEYVRQAGHLAIFPPL